MQKKKWLTAHGSQYGKIFENLLFTSAFTNFTLSNLNVLCDFFISEDENEITIGFETAYYQIVIINLTM